MSLKDYTRLLAQRMAGKLNRKSKERKTRSDKH
jgi:hypothetical protein